MKPWEVFAALAGLGLVVGVVLLIGEGYGGTVTIPTITIRRK